MFCHIGGSGGPQLNIHRSRSPVEQAFRFEEVSGRKRVRNGQAGSAMPFNPADFGQLAKQLAAEICHRVASAAPRYKQA